MKTGKTSFKEFCELVKETQKNGKIMAPVFFQYLADDITPVDVYKSLDENISPMALLESVERGAQGRYSIIAVEPFLKFTVNSGASMAEIFNEYSACTLMDYPFPKMSFYSDQREATTTTSKDPLAHLQKLLDRYSPVSVPGLSCFTGGAVGYFGYEAITLIEKEVPRNLVDELRCPDIYLYFYNKVIVFDHVNQSLYIIVNIAIPPEGSHSNRKCYNIARRAAEALKRRLDIKKGGTKTSRRFINESPIETNMEKEDFISMVKKAKEYIELGDIFQVVLSQRFQRDFAPDNSFDFYRLLRHINPSPYMFHLDMEKDFKLVGASPEVMVRIENGDMLIRPIAGTRKRGKTAEEDKRLADDLLTDEKELAEHKMLVDLGRDNVGRFTEIGSVKVKGMLRVEYYSHVMHIATDVIGKLASDISPFVACLGSLPAGTLSGAPKIRAMQIISELEPSCRGPYGGMVGWLTHGRLDSCIFIRSVVIKDGKIFWQSGAGIVHDSIPDAEYDETLSKALAIGRALEKMTKRR